MANSLPGIDTKHYFKILKSDDTYSSGLERSRNQDYSHYF
jgi:hypothetical protein